MDERSTGKVVRDIFINKAGYLISLLCIGKKAGFAFLMTDSSAPADGLFPAALTGFLVFLACSTLSNSSVFPKQFAKLMPVALWLLLASVFAKDFSRLTGRMLQQKITPACNIVGQVKKEGILNGQ